MLLNRYYWHRVRVVLAVVLQFPSNIEETKHDLVALTDDFDFPIEVHCYSLPDLKVQFGLADG